MPRWPQQTLAERFDRFVVRIPFHPCWEWSGGVAGPDSRGVFYRGKDAQPRQQYAARVAWEIANGPIPDGLLVLHHCDNPRCVRAEHLFLGTHEDNMRDMVEKGRHGAGERNSQAKLTAAQVAEIRSRVSGGERQDHLAEEFGVSKAAVCFIVSRRNWRLN